MNTSQAVKMVEIGFICYSNKAGRRIFFVDLLKYLPQHPEITKMAPDKKALFIICFNAAERLEKIGVYAVRDKVNFFLSKNITEYGLLIRGYYYSSIQFFQVPCAFGNSHKFIRGHVKGSHGPV